jgi:hypothetical protein
MNIEQLLIAKRNKAQTMLKNWDRDLKIAQEEGSKFPFSISFIEKQMAFYLGQISALDEALTVLEIN